MNFDVFISYSSKDKAIADVIVSTLEKSGIRCWVAPRDIEPGDDWGEAITKGIHECKMVLLIFSSHSNQSKRVLDEINFALSEEKTILPFRIENLDPTGSMRLNLSSQHWLDAYKTSWQEYLDRLVESVSANLWRVVSSSQPRVQPVRLERKNQPLWILSTAILAAALVVIGVLWGLNRKKMHTTVPTALALSQPTLVVEGSLTPTPSATATPMPTHTLEMVITEEPTQVEATTEPPAEIAPINETEVILNTYFMDHDISLNPQQWPQGDSISEFDNLFVQLTNYSMEKGEIVPEAAESWTISPDGKYYTFKLRGDIPWVVHTFEGETSQVLDEDGNPRFVTAQDFVETFQRLCDPRVGKEDLDLVYFHGLIKGCQQAAQYEDPQNIPAELIESIGVKAVSEDELLFELEKPSGYFLTMTGMWLFTPMPRWAMEESGDHWDQPGITPNNGYYVIDEFSPGQSMRWVRNDLFPSDIFPSGNIDVVEIAILSDDSDPYQMWRENKLDFVGIPQDELLAHRSNFPNETIQDFGHWVVFVVFRMSDTPFQNVHARRAFSAAFDRDRFISDVMEGQGIAMKHLTPPVVFGAPPLDEIGVGYDPEFAQAELAAAGYPGCQGFPHVRLFVRSDRLTSAYDRFLRSWEENLNCPIGTIEIVSAEKYDMADDLNADMMFSAWGSDYADAHNWFRPIVSCTVPFFLMGRSCNEIDDLIDQAEGEIVAVKRKELYAQIEEMLFGEAGETPLAPIYWEARFVAEHTWLQRDQTQIGKTFYNWTIDMDAKLAAKGEE
jgi:ABC-type oligopeptide transport system substrate-binding subunit